MLKRYSLGILGALLLAVLVLVTLLLLSFLRAHMEPVYFMQFACVWAAFTLLFLLLLGNALLRKLWFFPGTGDPVSLEQLREKLLSINKISCPVQVVGKRKKMFFSWRLTDATWCERMRQSHKPCLYELRCRLDVNTRTVFMVDRIRSVDLELCPDKVETGRRRIPLPVLRVHLRRLPLIDSYVSAAPESYALEPREIKAPVLGTIIACGWNVRLSLF